MNVEKGIRSLCKPWALSWVSWFQITWMHVRMGWPYSCLSALSTKGTSLLYMQNCFPTGLFVHFYWSVLKTYFLFCIERSSCGTFDQGWQATTHFSLSQPCCTTATTDVQTKQGRQETGSKAAEIKTTACDSVYDRSTSQVSCQIVSCIAVFKQSFK